MPRTHSLDVTLTELTILVEAVARAREQGLRPGDDRGRWMRMHVTLNEKLKAWLIDDQRLTDHLLTRSPHA